MADNALQRHPSLSIPLTSHRLRQLRSAAKTFGLLNATGGNATIDLKDMVAVVGWVVCDAMERGLITDPLARSAKKE